MEVFLTITSPAFSELVIILRDKDIADLDCRDAIFETLRAMHKVKRFKLAFLLEVPDSLQWDAQQRLGLALGSVATRGFLDFLDSPPTVRRTKFREVRWNTQRSPKLD